MDQLWKEDQEPNSSVAEFYRDKVVLLTGATGFFGKLYMEKLIRCEAKELILIVREKKGVPPRERVENLWKTEAVLKCFRRNVKNCQQRITVIAGDLEKAGVGLSEPDVEYIRDRTEIVIHAAADVRFDESLIKAILANVQGTWELLNLCTSMRKMELLIYISTAYANCIHETIEEKFYEPPTDPLMMLELAKKFNYAEADQLEALTPMIISPWPNTYTYTKALSEHLVQMFYNRLNITIIRPSIVTSTMYNPVPGWTDNLYGMTGFVLGTGCGILRVMYCANKMVYDVVPADFCINGSLVAGRYVAERNKLEPPSTDPDKVAIFHVTSGLDNPLEHGHVLELMSTVGWDHVPLKSFWLGWGLCTQYEFLAKVYSIFLHLIPGIIVDAALRYKGKTPRFMKIYRKIRKVTSFLKFFVTRTFSFENVKMRRVIDSMESADEAMFQCDIKTITWEDYFNSYCPGMKLYLLNEGPDTWDEAIRRRNRLQRIRWIIRLIFGFVTVYILSNAIYSHVFANKMY